MSGPNTKRKLKNPAFALKSRNKFAICTEKKKKLIICIEKQKK